MGQKPLTDNQMPSLVSNLWMSFDPAEDDRELLSLEEEVLAEMERVDKTHSETHPWGKPKESNVDVEEEADEEEEEEDDDDGSESPPYDSDDEYDPGVPSPTPILDRSDNEFDLDSLLGQG